MKGLAELLFDALMAGFGAIVGWSIVGLFMPESLLAIAPMWLRKIVLLPLLLLWAPIMRVESAALAFVWHSSVMVTVVAVVAVVALWRSYRSRYATSGQSDEAKR